MLVRFVLAELPRHPFVFEMLKFALPTKDGTPFLIKGPKKAFAFLP